VRAAANGERLPAGAVPYRYLASKAALALGSDLPKAHEAIRRAVLALAAEGAVRVGMEGARVAHVLPPLAPRPRARPLAAGRSVAGPRESLSRA
jgi:hypothetical protein